MIPPLLNVCIRTTMTLFLRCRGVNLMIFLLSCAVFWSALVPLGLLHKVAPQQPGNDNGRLLLSNTLSTRTTRTTTRTQSSSPRRQGGPPPLPPRLSQAKTCALAQTDFSKAAGLYCLVTGMEHSGTTLVSELIMSAPRVFGAFEGGFLLDQSPAKFYKRKTMYQWAVQPVTSSLHWGLSPHDRDAFVTQAACFAEMYRRVHQASPLFSAAAKTQDSWMVDKTPAYVYNLTRILQLTPNVPIVVTVKDEAAQLQSLVKRGVRRKGALQRLAAFERSLQDALASEHAHRLILVNMTHLYQHPNVVMANVFDTLGLAPWDPAYLTMEALNKKGAPLGRCVVPAFEHSANASSPASSKVVAGQGCQDNNGYAAGKRKQLEQKKQQQQQQAAQ